MTRIAADACRNPLAEGTVIHGLGARLIGLKVYAVRDYGSTQTVAEGVSRTIRKLDVGFRSDPRRRRRIYLAYSIAIATQSEDNY